MSSNSARKSVLQSIYCLRRRKSVIPITDLTGRRVTDPNGNGSSASTLQKPRASLVQQGKVRAPNVSLNSNGVGTSTLLMRNNNNIFPRNGATNGVRGHYAATAECDILDSIPFGTTLHDGQDFSSPYDNKSSTGVAFDDPLDVDKSQPNLVVVLDMDECLIHSQFLTIDSDSENNYRQYEDGRPEDTEAFDYDDESRTIVPTSCESFRLCLPDGDLVHVNKRPNLDTFLKEVTSRYETYIFTAAMEVYAAPLLDQLDPDGTMFRGRFYREHCTLHPSLGVYVKDLSNLKFKNDDHVDNTHQGYNQKRAVLIDNNPYSFLANPTNGILVSNFYDDPRDDTLQAVTDLLEELEPVDDVRPVLDQKFGLEDALKEVQSQGTWR